MSQTTKRALEASLKNMLLKKPFDKITINDITEDCGVSRMTFYYHFKDIYDLAEWSCEEDARRAIADNHSYKTGKEGLLQVFETVRENKPFIMNVYRCVSHEQVENYLFQITYSFLVRMVNESAEGMDVREEDKKFIADFYKYAFTGLMLDWIKNDMKEEPEKIIDKVFLLMQGNIPRALEAYRTDAGRIHTKE